DIGQAEEKTDARVVRETLRVEAGARRIGVMFELDLARSRHDVGNDGRIRSKPEHEVAAVVLEFPIGPGEGSRVHFGAHRGVVALDAEVAEVQTCRAAES